MIDQTIPRRIFWLALAIILAFTFVYVIVYHYLPFAFPWSDIYLNLAIDLPALLAAIFATLVWQNFQHDDAPRPVWRYFALGLWSWTVAEFSWTAIWLATGDVPTPSFPDIFWMLAFIFFGLAFTLQYRLVNHTGLRKEALWLGGSVLVGLVASLVTTALVMRYEASAQLTWIGVFFDVFYAYADLGITLAALGLARLFGRGLWARAWLGLLVMTLSDALYSILVISGLYALSASSGNLLSLVTDTLYALSYLILGLGCIGQYLLVRHGPSLTPRPAGDN